ncbi:hypothetical protein BZA05DRAFT_395554 [Tricharina praecox]|uniref:uncharacterized protein n=1 Tax=Tricharina praecox TaxID=43433 RepID=UPI00221FC3CE|nr:uncharacterized protein BZA05DRAFT_395554 [Tricharina praecox]KAI5853300.1 hypothetical protein BZA05DRAFT_395554 [Tricharina praecox]
MIPVVQFSLPSPGRLNSIRSTSASTNNSKLHVLRPYDKRLQPPFILHYHELRGLIRDGRLLAAQSVLYSVTLKLDRDSGCSHMDKDDGQKRDTDGVSRMTGPFGRARTPPYKELRKTPSMESWGRGLEDEDPYGHESLRTVDWRSSSGSESSDSSTKMGSSSKILRDLKRLPDCDTFERTRVWVNFGTYTVSTDLTPWQLLKYRVQSNRAKRDEEIARVIDLSTLLLSKPAVGAQAHSGGYEGQHERQHERQHGRGGETRRSGSKGDYRASGAGGQPPKRHKSSNNGGADSGRGPPQDNASTGGDAPSAGSANAILCSLCPEDPLFTTTDELLQHRVRIHCCPICEEKLQTDEIGRWVVPPQSEITFFRNNADMKQHISRIHLKPYMCPVTDCGQRLGNGSYKRHLRELHHYDEAIIYSMLHASGASNLGYQRLTDLVLLFKNNCPDKETMRGILYRNGTKLYDCENLSKIVDNLETHGSIPYGRSTSRRVNSRSRRGGGKRVHGGSRRPTNPAVPSIQAAPVPDHPVEPAGTAIGPGSGQTFGNNAAIFTFGNGDAGRSQPNEHTQQPYPAASSYAEPPFQHNGPASGEGLAPMAVTAPQFSHNFPAGERQSHPGAMHLTPAVPHHAATALSTSSTPRLPPQLPNPTATAPDTFEPGPPPATQDVDPAVMEHPLIDSRLSSPLVLEDWVHFDLNLLYSDFNDEFSTPLSLIDNSSNTAGNSSAGGGALIVPAQVDRRTQPSVFPAEQQGSHCSGLQDEESQGCDQEPGEEDEGEAGKDLTALGANILVDLEEFRELAALISSTTRRHGNGLTVAKMLYAWESRALILAILAHGTTAAKPEFTAWPKQSSSKATTTTIAGYGISDEELNSLHYKVLMKLKRFRRLWEAMSSNANRNTAAILAKLLCGDESCPLIEAIRQYADEATALAAPDTSTSPGDVYEDTATFNRRHPQSGQLAYLPCSVGFSGKDRTDWSIRSVYARR